MIVRVSGAGVACAAVSLLLGAQATTVPRPPPRRCRRARVPPPTATSRSRSGLARPAHRCRPEQRRSPSRRSRPGRTAPGSSSCPTAASCSANATAVSALSARTAALSQPLTGMPSDMATAGQSLFSVERDKAFATNRVIYFTYAVIPAGVDPATQRSPAHVHVARARIAADEKSLEESEGSDRQ